MRRARAALPVLTMAVLYAPGCARNDPPSDPFEPVATTLVVTVRNQYELDVILHAYGPALAERLGSLAPGRSARWEVPWREVGDIRIRVEPSTGPHLESNALTVHPGDEVLLTIPSDLTRTVLIRR